MQTSGALRKGQAMNLIQVFRNYWQAASDATRVLWGYRRTAFWLLRHKGLRMFYNFIYMKLFVKEGHGSLGWAFWVGMPFLKLFRHAFARHTPYPCNVEVEVTTRCDKRCIICENVYWPKEERRAHLTFAEFRALTDQFPNLKWIDLTGEGDAFLNPDFIPMLRHLKERRVCVYFADSFDRINEQMAEEIIRLGIDGIYLSMDAATAETYNKIKVGADFDRVCHNVETLLRLKAKYRSPIPELCFRFVIITLNVQEMPDFVKIVGNWQQKYDLGDGTRIEFVGLLRFPEIEHLFVPEVPPEILEAVECAAREYKVRIGLAHHSVSAAPPPERCSVWVEPYIMLGGYVMPCCAVMQNNKRPYLREHCMGNLYEIPLTKLWYSEHYRKFRETVINPEAPIPTICKDCRVYNTKPRAERYGYVRFRPEGIEPMTAEELEADNKTV